MQKQTRTITGELIMAAKQKLPKIKWKVSDIPVGRYRSFEKRGWPSAEYLDGRAAFYIYCDDEYRPRNVKTGNHKELTVKIAEWFPERSAEYDAFRWHTLKNRFATLKEAKEAAMNALKAHPHFVPKDLQ
jgi:hypothetical protein